MKQLTTLLTLCLLAACCLTGCKSTKKLAEPQPVEDQYLSSKIMLTIPRHEGTITVNGTMKMKKGEIVQVSLLMPVLRTEIARLEATPYEGLALDRMNKRYLKANMSDLKQMVPQYDFAKLQKVFTDAAADESKRTLKGSDFGISKLRNAKVELYDFSSEEMKVWPTTIPSGYEQMTLADISKILGIK